MNPEITNLQNSPSDCPFELILGCRRGDHRAQLQVYKLFYKPVFNICRQIVNDPVVAEDVMQESFLLAFEHIDSYIGDKSFSSWINRFIKSALQYKYSC